MLFREFTIVEIGCFIWSSLSDAVWAFDFQYPTSTAVTLHHSIRTGTNVWILCAYYESTISVLRICMHGFHHLNVCQSCNSFMFTPPCGCWRCEPAFSNVDNRSGLVMIAKDGLGLWHKLLSFLMQ